MNIHKGCPHYVPENDMCLAYYHFGYFDMSKNYPEDCVDHFVFAEHYGFTE